MRKFIFQNEFYYHVCNRGVDKREVFCDEQDYLRFLESMKLFNRAKPIGSLHEAKRISGSTANKAVEPLSPLVEIICYCLNPNHFHILLKQLIDGGISEFIKRLAGGYTWYFNFRNKRCGSLFQGKFKAIEIKSEDHLSYVSSYINGNAEIHGIAKAEYWQYSSYPDFLGRRHGIMNNKNLILKEFTDITEYKNYTKNVIKNSKEIKEELKKLHNE